MSVEQLQSLLQYTSEGMDDAEIEASMWREDYRHLLRNHILCLRANTRWQQRLQPVFEGCVEFGLITAHEAQSYGVSTAEDELTLARLVDTYREKFGRDPFVDAAEYRGRDV